MKIGVFSGSTQYAARFETPCQKIAIFADGVTQANIEDANITITMMDRSGQLKTITPKTRLGDLMEIAASNEGLVYWVKTATPSYQVRSTIELSNFGAIDIQGGYFQIQLDNAVSTTSWSLFAMEAEALTNSIIRYSPIWVAQNQYKNIELKDEYACALPVASIDELHITYANGRTNIFTADELKQIALENNELAVIRYNYTASNYEAIPGYNAFVVIGLKGAISVRVRCNAATTIYMIDDEQL